MALIGFNRKLLWAVLPAIVWAYLGLSVMSGPQPYGELGFRPPMRFGLGPREGAIFVRGTVRRIIEEPQQLRIVLETQRGGQAGGNDNPAAKQPGLPGLVLEEVAPGQIAAAPLELRLRSGAQQPRRLPGGASGVLTERFIIKLEQDGVRVMPRPFDLKPPRARDEGRDRPGGDPGQRRGKLHQQLREWLHGRRDERRSADNAPEPPPPPEPAPPGSE